MKKKLMSTAVLSLLLMSIGGDVFAAPVSAKRETTAEFEAGGRPEVVEPEEGPSTPKPLEPDTKPLPDSDDIYVTHLPDISFGTGNKTSIKTVEHQAVWEKRSAAVAGGGTVDYYSPHSVQVADMSGNAASKWLLDVAQDDVYKSVSHELEASRIRLYGSTVTSSLEDNTSVAAKIKGAALDQTDAFGAYSYIPVTTKDTGVAPLVVLDATSTPGAGIGGYISTVFEEDYDKADYDESKTPTAERYDGIKLNIPAGDKAQKVAYRADLTWTLTVTP